MNFRLAILLTAITALAASVAFARWHDGPAATEPSPQASRRAPAADVQRLEQAVRDRPDDVAARSALASAYLQRARQAADPSYYALAEKSVQRALALAPDDTTALVVAGDLALARHDFAGALAIAERARASNPDVVAVYGVLTDALVELGRYEDAAAAAQEMIDRRPDFASYSRVSYLRELHGDVDGAIEAMAQAAASAQGLGYDDAWANVLLGDLHLRAGDIDAADRAYARAERALPDDPMTHAGLARFAVARGDLADAERRLRIAVGRRPLPEYAIAFGDLLAAQGRTADAEQQFALVRAIATLFEANGVDTDLDLALFEADHGTDPETAYRTALAAYERRPTIFAAEAVAWSAYRAGRIDEARAYVDRALRLGTRDPRLAYHAGVIYEASGDIALAERYLRDAASMSDAQSPLLAAEASIALQRVTAQAVW